VYMIKPSAVRSAQPFAVAELQAHVGTGNSK
jgi:hypothetical protein